MITMKTVQLAWLVYGFGFMTGVVVSAIAVFINKTMKNP